MTYSNEKKNSISCILPWIGRLLFISVLLSSKQSDARIIKGIEKQSIGTIRRLDRPNQQQQAKNEHDSNGLEDGATAMIEEVALTKLREPRISEITATARKSSKFECFLSTSELKESVAIYLSSPDRDAESEVAIKYGFPIGKWCVDSITDFSEIFADQVEFTGIDNDDISKWNTGAATSMRGMFRNCPKFTGSLKKWSTSNVLDMSQMFLGAASFNDKGVTKWDVSLVSDMSEMFRSASSFDQKLKKWNIANAQNMSYMFDSASIFNQNLCDWGIIIMSRDGNVPLFVDGMFQNSLCPYTQDPAVTETEEGTYIVTPFCEWCLKGVDPPPQVTSTMNPTTTGTTTLPMDRVTTVPPSSLTSDFSSNGSTLSSSTVVPSDSSSDMGSDNPSSFLNSVVPSIYATFVNTATAQPTKMMMMMMTKEPLATTPPNPAIYTPVPSLTGTQTPTTLTTDPLLESIPEMETQMPTKNMMMQKTTPTPTVMSYETISPTTSTTKQQVETGYPTIPLTTIDTPDETEPSVPTQSPTKKMMTQNTTPTPTAMQYETSSPTVRLTDEQQESMTNYPTMALTVVQTFLSTPDDKMTETSLPAPSLSPTKKMMGKETSSPTVMNYETSSPTASLTEAQLDSTNDPMLVDTDFPVPTVAPTKKMMGKETSSPTVMNYETSLPTASLTEAQLDSTNDPMLVDTDFPVPTVAPTKKMMGKETSSPTAMNYETASPTASLKEEQQELTSAPTIALTLITTDDPMLVDTDFPVPTVAPTKKMMGKETSSPTVMNYETASPTASTTEAQLELTSVPTIALTMITTDDPMLVDTDFPVPTVAPTKKMMGKETSSPTVMNYETASPTASTTEAQLELTSAPTIALTIITTDDPLLVDTDFPVPTVAPSKKMMQNATPTPTAYETASPTLALTEQFVTSYPTVSPSISLTSVDTSGNKELESSFPETTLSPTKKMMTPKTNAPTSIAPTAAATFVTTSDNDSVTIPPTEESTDEVVPEKVDNSVIGLIFQEIAALKEQLTNHLSEHKKDGRGRLLNYINPFKSKEQQ
jgi:Mycoplasma protein of unknown function, DUF285